MVQGKPGGTVHISNGMPDVEALMQQWPLEVEQKLHTMKLPDSTLVTPFALLHIVCVCVSGDVYVFPTFSRGRN